MATKRKLDTDNKEKALTVQDYLNELNDSCVSMVSIPWPMISGANLMLVEEFIKTRTDLKVTKDARCIEFAK